MILTLEDAVRARINECAANTVRRYRASVRPIYASPDGLRPTPLGSCMLFLIDEKRFVVTAAHVTDDLEGNALYVGGLVGTRPVQIVGEVRSTPRPRGGRRRDLFDCAIWPLSDEAASQLGAVEFLTMADVSLNRIDTTGRWYTAIGYPYSRNKRGVDRARRKIKVVVRSFTNEVSVLPKLAAELNVSGEDHFFLSHQKYSYDPDGVRSSSFNPKGMSGGALVDLGNFRTFDAYRPEDRRTGKICGMLIERRPKHQAIVALKIQAIISAVHRHYGAAAAKREAAADDGGDPDLLGAP